MTQDSNPKCYNVLVTALGIFGLFKINFLSPDSEKCTVLKRLQTTLSTVLHVITKINKSRCNYNIRIRKVLNILINFLYVSYRITGITVIVHVNKQKIHFKKKTLLNHSLSSQSF